MANKTDRFASLVVTGVALLLAVVIVRREFFPAAAASPIRVREEMRFDSSWKELPAIAITFGRAEAPIQLVEFVDFECPVCRMSHQSTLKALRERFADSLTLHLVHFPLTRHKFARPAAMAVECVSSDRRGALIEQLFLKQDSLGLKPWTAFAHEAGVVDTALLARCMRADASPRIDAGFKSAQHRGVPGTPYFIVNGWSMPSVPTEAEFQRVIKATLAGRDPRE